MCTCLDVQYYYVCRVLCTAAFVGQTVRRGGGHNFKKTVAEVATVELFCCLCHRKDNNHSYTFAAGCIRQAWSDSVNFFKDLTFENVLFRLAMCCPYKA